MTKDRRPCYVPPKHFDLYMTTQTLVIKGWYNHCMKIQDIEGGKNGILFKPCEL